MTINPYFFNQFGSSNEQNLTEDLIIEMIQLSGRNFFYIPRIEGNVDEVLQEAALSNFEGYSIVEMYVNNFVNFGGNSMMLTPIGAPILNQLELVVSKKRFTEEVQDLPLAGDLVYESLSKILYKIDFVDDEPNLNYQLQKNYTHVLKCSPFVYSYEDFNTGITELDNALNPNTFNDKFNNQDKIVQETIDNEYLNSDESNPLGLIIPEE